MSDSDKNGFLDYQEFTDMVLGEKKPTPKTPQKTQIEEGGDSEVLKEMKRRIKERGTKGIIGLGKLFRIIDDNNNGRLEKKEFQKVLKDFRLKFNEDETAKLFQEFDRDRDGSVDYNEFLRTIRVRVKIMG